MSGRKKPRKIINGFEHIQCVECGEWIILRPNIYRCQKHQRTYNQEYYQKNKKKFRKSNVTQNYYNQDVIDKELKGVKITGGLFEGLSDETKEVLRSGSVHLLLNTNITRIDK